MARKRAIPDDEELKGIIKQRVYDVMQTATKKSNYSEYTCRECGQRQRVQVEVSDHANVLKAASELWDRMEGKAATKRDAPKPKTAGRSMDELSDEELEALVAGGTDGEVVNGSQEEAAG